MRKLLIWLPLVLFLGFFALFASGLFKPDDRVITSKLIGQALPAFTLPAAASDRPALASTQLADGKPRLLNIFASWCIPCAAEAPQLMTLKQAGVEIDAIAIRDARPDVDAFLMRNGNPYSRIGLDARSGVQIALGSSGVPETFVIDGRGRIAYQHIGDIRADDVPMLLQRLLMLAAPVQAQTALPPAPYADRQLDDPALERKAKALMETIRCLTCQSQSIADSNASMAGDMRSEIRERIRAGEEPEHIRRWLIERYGDWVSYEPTAAPILWPLWAAPIVLLSLGLLLMRGRIKRRPRA